jgi:hypothetical protein
MVSKDRQSKGEHRPLSKLTEAQVLSIRGRYALGEMQKDLAKEHGVARVTVYKIVHGKSWAYLCK